MGRAAMNSEEQTKSDFYLCLVFPRFEMQRPWSPSGEGAATQENGTIEHFFRLECIGTKEKILAPQTSRETNWEKF